MEEGKWVDVKDALPEHGQEIKFMGYFPFVCEGFFEKTEKGYLFYQKFLEGTNIYNIIGVTHWLPIIKGLNGRTSRKIFVGQFWNRRKTPATFCHRHNRSNEKFRYDKKREASLSNA